ncbi:hypothetical protein, partial [uncultured Cohaesibacter sp.]|uniref:hypothetical protein n=1 Tax=uncultured Cohaesibacter sp. TaxID=1002546 RepID=UPI0029300C62
LSKNQEEFKEGEDVKLKRFRAAQLAPLVDRIGRMYADLGTYFSSLSYGAPISGAETQRIPRFAETGPSQFECQFGVPPNPSQISALSRRSRAEPTIFFHEVVLSPSVTTTNAPPREFHNVEIQTQPMVPIIPEESNEDLPKPNNSSAIWNPEEVDLILRLSTPC